MDAREESDFGRKRPEFIGRAAVRPPAFLEDAPVHHGIELLFPEVVGRGRRGIRVFRARQRSPLLGQRRKVRVSRSLLSFPQRFSHAGREILYQRVVERTAGFKERYARFCRLPGFSNDFFLKGDERSNFLLRVLERLSDDVLGHFPRSALQHINFLGRAGNHEIKIRCRPVGECRIHDPGLIRSADADSGYWPIPRDVGEREGQRGAEEGKGVRIVFFVEGEDGRHHLHFVSHAEVEARPDSAIDEAANEDGFFRRAVLALDESRTEDFPGRVKSLLIVNGEREEIPALAGFF